MHFQLFFSSLSKQEGAPNYFPNSFSGPLDARRHMEAAFTCTRDVSRYNSADEDNFTQAGNLFRDVSQVTYDSSKIPMNTCQKNIPLLTYVDEKFNS